MDSHLGLPLLAVDNLGWDDLGGGGLGTGAHAFGLGDNHLGDGSGGCDDGWFGPLNSLQGLLTLRRNGAFVHRGKTPVEPDQIAHRCARIFDNQLLLSWTDFISSCVKKSGLILRRR